MCDQTLQVHPNVNLLTLRDGNQTNKACIAYRGSHASDEQLVLAPNRDSLHEPLDLIVIDLQAAVGGVYA
ncbi:hypothetical protein VN12_08105 [Pirellula sp. SH-Sr6A]|nr:hypothetical protein [Pirellula sp. SH-Sr6A]AMV32071.1 hypothetical protein VN12_08105 [Pirellula sp. SH-Sr6A]